MKREVERLAPEEQRRLAGLERQIDLGMQTFLVVGNALAEVRDRRLHRSTFDSFEAYCSKRWSLSRSRAYELMDAAEVVSGIPDMRLRPSNASQAGALAAAPPEERADVMAAVAEKGKPTAAAIAAEVAERHPTPSVEDDPPFEVCERCDEVEGPGFSGGVCQDCWENQGNAEAERGAQPRTKPPQPRTKPLRAQPEVQESDRLSKPLVLLTKAIKDMPDVADLLTLDPGTLESYDVVAVRIARWSAEWTEARKATTGLRLVKES